MVVVAVGGLWFVMVGGRLWLHFSVTAAVAVDLQSFLSKCRCPLLALFSLFLVHWMLKLLNATVHAAAVAAAGGGSSGGGC